MIQVTTDEENRGEERKRALMIVPWPKVKEVMLMALVSVSICSSYFCAKHTSKTI